MNANSRPATQKLIYFAKYVIICCLQLSTYLSEHQLYSHTFLFPYQLPEYTKAMYTSFTGLSARVPGCQKCNTADGN